MKPVDAVLDEYSELLHILGLPSELLRENENGSFHFRLLNRSPKYFLIDIQIDADFPAGPSKGWPAAVLVTNGSSILSQAEAQCSVYTGTGAGMTVICGQQC